MSAQSDGESLGSPDREVLFAAVYAHLRAIAELQMRGERKGHTLTATALVHEAFLRVGGDGRLHAGGRVVLLHAATEAMRRILIEHARARGREKRGGGKVRVSLDAIGDVADLAAIDRDDGDHILAFDRAFERLQKHDERVSDVVRLRFYGGLTIAETAEALGLSSRTVNNAWLYARAWLAREIGQDAIPASKEPG